MCTCNQKTVTLKSFVCISRGERWAWFYKRSGKKPNGRPTCAEKSNFGYRNSLPFSFCILFSGFVLLSRFCCSLLQCSSMGKKSGRSAAKNIQNAYPFGWETDTNTHTFEKKSLGYLGIKWNFSVFASNVNCICSRFFSSSQATYISWSNLLLLIFVIQSNEISLVRKIEVRAWSST